MKNFNKYIVAGIFSVLSASACKTDFLEIKPKGTDLESNYYKDEVEAFNGLIAVYDVLGWQGGFVTKENTVLAASDDHVAGGGNATDVNELQVMSNYTLTPDRGPQAELWRGGFSGIFRANTLLLKLPEVPMDENTKKRFVAETKFLRAYFYFDLVRFFKNVPLFTVPVPTNEMYDVAQATPEAVYTQIEQDLKDAIAEPNLPNTIDIVTNGGRVTKGAAHALLGKVYLFQKKYSPAAAELALVNGTPGQTNVTYGYRLLANFSDLWKTNNKYNTESILEIAHSSKSGGNWGCIACTEGNVQSIMLAPRQYVTLSPSAPGYISGYGFLPFTKNFFDDIHYDPRNKATVANLDSLEANNIVTYEKSYQNTGYFIEKLAGKKADESTGAGDKPLNFPQNKYAIRLADTYLMEAEALISGNGDLVRAAALINAVRARAHNGVPNNVAATLVNLKRERRLELAGEGHRWFDIIRWGDAATLLASKGFVAGKHEVLPIPLNELSNTKIEQNKEWGGTK